MPPDQPLRKARLAHALFGDIVQTTVAEATATVTVSARPIGNGLTGFPTTCQVWVLTIHYQLQRSSIGITPV